MFGGIDAPLKVSLDVFRHAIRHEQKLRIQYQNAESIHSDRTILPLALTYYVEVAVVSAWCELRGDFRHFRADRVLDCQALTQNFHGRGQQLRRRMDLATPE